MTDQPPIRILYIMSAFYPAIAYGGPIFSLKVVTDGIAARPDFAVEVLTTDAADPNTGERLKLDANPARFPAGYDVRYCRSVMGKPISVEMMRRLPAAIRRADIVHLTGPYDFAVLPTLLLARIMRKPVVWSPRGGFQATSQWKNAPKRRIKQAFERVAGTIRPGRTVLHVTAEVEAETSRPNLGTLEAAVIPNAIDVPADTPARDWQPDGKLRLGFLSRVHPKKGLDLLIEAMTGLPDHVTLDIYGDGDATYLAQLRDRIAQSGLTGRIAFHGLVDGERKSAAFRNCDLFVLPTYSENFGIVVAEALAHGTPVVVTKGAPWQGIEDARCGHWTDITSDGLREAIAACDGEDLQAMGQRGRAWMLRDFSAQGTIERFDALYRKLGAGHDVAEGASWQS
ncbi:glycosyltransferase [Palleronia abyssalis]|uniref:Mannosylfructose-phosphate synthase n=1 Tax=Palleronia abyssalis TaxID=1501240 RepID=A0A2R8BSC5_9RHOB|nr:glycosyltransferase [Palleronia abyssalis]SPJ23043.1 Mannosylfructose-phosphate synthase [Palleronia abyssalis]